MAPFISGGKSEQVPEIVQQTNKQYNIHFTNAIIVVMVDCTSTLTILHANHYKKIVVQLKHCDSKISVY